jgi:hypothetical protein
MSTTPHPRFERNIASLVGGVGVALFVGVLWIGIGAWQLGHAGPLLIATGIAAALLVGFWVRLADL